MTLYLANYASFQDAEAVCDSKLSEVFETLTNPSGFILTDRTQPHIDALLAAAQADHCLDGNGDPRTDWVPDWQTEGWREEYKCQEWQSPDLEVTVELREVLPLEPKGGPT